MNNLSAVTSDNEVSGQVNQMDPCPLSSSLKSLEGKNEPENSSGVLTPGNSSGVPVLPDWTDDAACLSGLAERLEEESAAESDRGNDSAACAWTCRAYELRQIVSRMVRPSGVTVSDGQSFRKSHPDKGAAS